MSDDKDPLAEWRTSLAPQRPAVAAGKEIYTAFDDPVDRRPARLHVCPPQDRAWEWLNYYEMRRVVHDGPHGTRIGLVWADAVVIIKGRNLQKLDRHLAQEAVAEVRAFDPARFHPVKDETAPYISDIEIITESRKTMMEAEMQLIAEIDRRH